ncbi:MAG: M20/M25/M40 family metallo-hydrolase [Tenacibaculum sp.]
MIPKLTLQAIDLLKKLIETPSFSSEEDKTAQLLENWFKAHNIPYTKTYNNIWAVNKFFDTTKPSLLLNSHHDTVKPNKGYTKNPFKAVIEMDKLYGLGSNDAGASLVSLLACFSYFYSQKNLAYNLVFAGTAEEENSGPRGLKYLLSTLPNIDIALVGEPTQMQLAIAEKGLIVYDAQVSGTPSHAAHPNTDNAIYNTIEVLQWFQNLSFEKKSKTLGEVKTTVTQISAGVQHNAVPAEVKLVVDIRVNDLYTNDEIDFFMQQNAPCSLKNRGLHLNSSSILISHSLVQAGLSLGRKTYGSPTLSDQAVLHCPSLKLGPGNSTRSHTADEFIYIREVKQGIELYIKILNKFLKLSK